MTQRWRMRSRNLAGKCSKRGLSGLRRQWRRRGWIRRGTSSLILRRSIRMPHWRGSKRGTKRHARIRERRRTRKESHLAQRPINPPSQRPRTLPQSLLPSSLLNLFQSRTRKNSKRSKRALSQVRKRPLWTRRRSLMSAHRWMRRTRIWAMRWLNS